MGNRPILVLRRLFLLLAISCLAACDRQSPEVELTGLSMGTTYSVKMVSPPATLDQVELHQSINELLTDLESAMSTYIPGSYLSRFNASRSTDWFETNPAVCRAVAEALSISAHTDGAFDITVGPLVNLWGFGPDGRIDSPASDADIAAAIATVGHAKVRADCARPALKKAQPEIYVDLSGYAKGYAVDRVAEHLEEAGVTNYLVELGGELRFAGHNSKSENWAIAIEKPDSLGRSVQSIIRPSGGALATSGDYRNFFEFEGQRYSHTIDPRSGSPVTHNAASVTVINNSASYADAIATALLVMGPEKGFEFAESQGIAALFLIRVGEDYEERMTSTFLAATER